MSRYYRSDDEQKGYDARTEDRFSSRYDGGYDFEQGWLERDREERRVQERREEEAQMLTMEERQAYEDSMRRHQEEQQVEDRPPDGAG